LKAQSNFLGAVLDTGAQKSVIGIKQAESYCEIHSASLNRQASQNTASLFKFGSKAHRSIGTLHISIPTPKKTMFYEVDVIDLDVPLLLGLDFLDRFSLNALSVQNRICCVKDNWILPITRKHGHLYLCWAPTFSPYYTRSQLDRLHRHFFHPSAGKLLNLLRRADRNVLTPETRQLLQEISSSCETCVRYSSAPISFQVRMPDEIVFNKEIRMDLMYLDENNAQF
jgi:hypothetical protein